MNKATCWIRMKSENGYTLVETLVAGALLVGVLIPTLLFFGRMTQRRADSERLVAVHLAQEAMEKTAAYHLYSNFEEKIVQQGVQWKVSREVIVRMDLVAITIRVTRARTGREMASLQTLRVL